jgi:hypothetical protein
LNEENSNSARTEEGKTEEPHQEELETSSTTPTIKVSTITHHVVSAMVSNQSSQIYQSTQSTVTNNSIHTQSKSLGRSMENEMRLPIFRGDGSKYPNQHWFLCEAIWTIK